MRHWTLFLLLAPIVGHSSWAAAASLSVAPDAPCLDAVVLTDLVERELGIALDAAVPLRFEVSVDERSGRYEARLDMFDDRGASARRRLLEAADCATLQETVAVAMTLALSAEDSSSALVPSLNAAEAVYVSDSATPAAPRDTTPPSLDGAPPSESAAWIPSLSAGLLVDAGTLPAASLGTTIGAALRMGRIEIQALGTLLFERRVEIEGRLATDGAASLGFVAGSLLACTALWGEPHSVAGSSEGLSSRACLGWELGQLTGEGHGIDRPRRGQMLWSAPRLDIGGRVALPLTPWGVNVSLAAELPVNRDDFIVGADALVHRPPLIVARAGLAVDLAFE